MSGTDSLAARRHQVLEAREARAALVGRLARRITLSGGQSLLLVSTSVPGPLKRPAGLDALLHASLGCVRDALPRAATAVFGADRLGPFHSFFAPDGVEPVKRAMVRLEEGVAGGRLLDLDVYDEAGEPFGRAALGLAPRRCLVCDDPAVDCIRRQRHDPARLDEAVLRLLETVSPTGQPAPFSLAGCLSAGAMTELRVTPKPGLVDLRDNGSHPDLTFDLMARSAGLLPDYLTELAGLRRCGAALADCVAAGQRAERQMFDEVGTNAHKGYIFLAGLVTLAGVDAPDGSNLPALRARTAELARQLLAGRAHEAGIRREAAAGLPAVFDEGLPRFISALDSRGDLPTAAHLLMARLMQVTEDTTSVRRCGREGLARVQRDGAELAAAIEGGADHLPLLDRWNDEYRAMRLTLGGVADLMALTLGLFFATHPGHQLTSAETCLRDGRAL